MRTLITGATGFLGSHLHAALGCSVASRSQIDLARPSPRVWRNLLEGHERLLICSAISDVERCYRERELSHAVNVAGTCALIEACRDVGTLPVFFSSDYVFGESPVAKREDDPRTPSTVYGQQKLAVERHLENGSVPFLLLRTGKQVACSLHRRNFLASMLSRLLAGETIACFSDQTMNPLFVEDVGRILMELPDLRGVYHLGSRAALTRADLGRRLALAAGQDVNLVKPTRMAEMAFSEPRPANNTLDCSRIEGETGFRFTELDDVLPRLAAIGRKRFPGD